MSRATAYELHQRGQRTIACYHWRHGSYLQLSESQPEIYSVHGQARGKARPAANGPSYREYFDKPVWMAVRID